MDLSSLARIFALLLLSNTAFSYPTTIGSKRIKTCRTCHVTASGGTLLNGYGRLLSNTMSTFGSEEETQGFFEDIKISGDYRHLNLFSKETGNVNFPMLLDVDLGFEVTKGLLVAGSLGVYGRTRLVESRENYVQVDIFSPTNTIRVGYFMPSFGILTNDHSLQTKLISGLSRGGERYNIELWHLNDYFQIFYTASTSQYAITPYSDYNTFRIGVPYGEDTHKVRASVMYFKHYEIGLQYSYNIDSQLYGGFARGSIIKNQYFLFEQNYLDQSSARWVRVGYFLFKGFDIFVEQQNSANQFSDITEFAVGFDWMIRPRIEVGFKLFLGDSPSQLQTHLWL